MGFRCAGTVGLDGGAGLRAAGDHRERRCRNRRAEPLGDVDLHSALRWYGSRDNARFFDEAEVAVIGETAVRVPRVEDHLRALCLHFLRHRAVRPVRLCDIALLMERYGADLTWDRVLRGSRSQVEQIGVGIRLAEDLLGARVTDAPIPPLPGWLMPAVLDQFAKNTTHAGAGALHDVLTRPNRVHEVIREKWPTPILATVTTGISFNGWPREVNHALAFLREAYMYFRFRFPGQVMAHFQMNRH